MHLLSIILKYRLAANDLVKSKNLHIPFCNYCPEICYGLFINKQVLLEPRECYIFVKSYYVFVNIYVNSEKKLVLMNFS